MARGLASLLKKPGRKVSTMSVGLFRNLLRPVLFLAFVVSASAENWPSFRGPNASGIADDRPLPTRWQSTSTRWKTPIPGLAHSSPVVWGERVFITTAVSLNSSPAFKAQTDDNDPVIETARYS